MDFVPNLVATRQLLPNHPVLDRFKHTNPMRTFAEMDLHVLHPCLAIQLGFMALMTGM